MEIHSKLKTNWGEVRVIHVCRTPLEVIETLGRAKRTREMLKKKLNVRNDVGASRRAREMGEKLLNSLEEIYGQVNNKRQDSLRNDKRYGV